MSEPSTAAGDDARGKNARDATTIEQFAAISAEIAEGDRPLTEVLARHDLTPDAWNEVSARFTRAIADAMEAGDDALADAYTAAFAAAQDALTEVAPMTPEEWAALVVEVGRTGAEPALATRGITPAGYLRLSRRWARVLASDKGQAQRYFQAFYALDGSRR